MHLKTLNLINYKNFKNQTFEFNSKVIALMQINFEEHNINKNQIINSFIFIIYPPNLKDGVYNFFIKKILCNKNIYKILHGSDSLDIPDIYYELIKDNELIIKFTNNLIDTRFLCEYNIIENNLDDKCKIYYVLNRENIISDIQYSLNKRDNLYNIKDNKLYKKNKIISEIISIS